MSEFERIVRDIIFDSPPEEISSVYDNLKILSEGQSNQKIISIIQEFNEARRLPVSNGSDRYILSEYNKSGSKYFDPIKNVLFAVDQVTHEASDLEEYSEESASEEHFSIYEDLKKYAAKYFPNTSSIAVFKIDGGSDYAIIIVSKKKSLGDFWTGYWVSEYVFNSDKNEISGAVSVDAHYFEDGNVRFKADSKLEATAAESPIVAIKQFESKFEKNLIDKFQYMNETQFKSLRRRLPVTRAKINWTQGIGNYRLGRDAAQGA